MNSHVVIAILGTLFVIMGLWCILWGPDYFRNTIESGRFSQEEGRDKITKVKIRGYAFILCGIALYADALLRK